MSKPDRFAWFPFYGRDFFFDETVQLFSLRQYGIYLVLLWHQWEHGSLPPLKECENFPAFAKDQHEDFMLDPGPNYAARSTTQAELAQVFTRCFPAHPSLSKRFANPRLLQVRLEQDAKNEVYQQRARKGGLAKSTSQAHLKHPTSSTLQARSASSTLDACYSESERDLDLKTQEKKEKSTPWYETFTLSDTMKAWCQSHRFANPEQHLEPFQDHFRKTGGKMKSGQQVKDPDAAFRTWMRNTKTFNPQPPPSRTSRNLAALPEHEIP